MKGGQRIWRSRRRQDDVRLRGTGIELAYPTCHWIYCILIRGGGYGSDGISFVRIYVCTYLNA